MSKKWSFDDMHIGQINDVGNALKTRVIDRPPYLTTLDWWRHAKTICEVLNRLDP